MDTFARGLKAAYQVLHDSDLKKLLQKRYASFENNNAKLFEEGRLTLSDLHQLAKKTGEPAQRSAHQEYFENIINNHIR
jgi:xylose isomerase